MSNKLAKAPTSREDIMQTVANEAIYKVQQYVGKAGLSNTEVITVLASLAKGLQETVKRNLTEYVDDKPDA
jgi:hypothetical protein